MASPQPERLQRAFNVLVDLFGQVGLRKNVWKTVIMACLPCYIPGRFSESAYMRQVTVVGPSHQERLWRSLECPECKVGLAVGSLQMHIQVYHGMGLGGQGQLQPPHPHPHPLGSLRPIDFPSQRRSRSSGAQWWDARGGWPAGPTSGFTLRTAMCDMPLWSWRRATGPTLAVLSAICLCLRDHWTAGIPPLPSVDGWGGGGVMLGIRGGRGGRVGGGNGTHFLRPPSHGGTLFQVPGAGNENSNKINKMIKTNVWKDKKVKWQFTKSKIR